MDQAEEIQNILDLQDQLVRYRKVWDVGPWLELDMSTPQLKALLLISEEKGIRMRELAHRLGGSFSNATVLVDRLVDRGLGGRAAPHRAAGHVLAYALGAPVGGPHLRGPGHDPKSITRAPRGGSKP